MRTQDHAHCMPAFSSAGVAVGDEAAVRPGRSCPLHYRYPPAALNRQPEIEADTLYIVGGLYGNRPALDAIFDRYGTEPGTAALVFNGDFNWFNVDPAGFGQINTAVLQHFALRGNVETELASDDASAGCGCGYPDSVADEDVARSNRIIERLRRTAVSFPSLRRRLAALPMHLVAAVGGVRVGIVHGDAESLAGWNFSREQLAATADAVLARQFAAANVAVFASTHTCLPVAKALAVPGGEALVINNGSAGMPNLRGTAFGLVTRIARRPARSGTSCLTLRCRGLFVDLLKIDFDQRRWLDDFLENWPADSPAHQSYFRRITSGPSLDAPIVV
ncbi:MAG TPA: hypothetical protein VFM11_13180 [Burkholderiales bacterium]|nr:hypothetical protein [Burkholderiales bacterium]